MLPSLGFQEILLLGVLALVVVGPKDLPLLLRKLGRWTAKLRGMAQEFRTGFDELARQAELEELKREVEALRKTTSLNDIAREMQKPLPTLEDYAGVSKPAPAPAPAPALEAPEASPSAASGEQDTLAVEPEKGASEDARPVTPLEVSERAEVAPVARSAP